jgi:hypothetical protein
MTDEEAIGAVIDEMYDSISGPRGQRDWSRLKASFLPRARLIRTWVDDKERPAMLIMSQEEYAHETTPSFIARDFYEIETARRFDIFGNIAHVWSHYTAGTSRKDKDIERRGINSIQLFRDPDHGWRVIHMIWDNERD